MLGTFNYDHTVAVGALLTLTENATLKMWCVAPEQCDLVMQTQISLEAPGDKVRSVSLFSKARCIVVVSEQGEAFLISSEKGIGEKVPILGGVDDKPSKVLTFQTFKGEKLLAVGMESGEVIIKHQH